FQAVIIWRDELNEGKRFLRDIIDLEATDAGPDAKSMPATGAPAAGEQAAPGSVVPFNGGPPQTVAPPSAPPAATPFKPANGGDAVDPGEQAAMADAEVDEDD